jgi:flagellar assembly protein FliH
MSSSASPAFERQQPAPEVRSFPYPDAGSITGAEPFDGASSATRATEDAAHREAVAREAGRQEGQVQAQAQLQAVVAQARDAVAQTIQSFVRERETYFQKVEAEVVGLALSIARKILHREAQLDPLLLAGMVRVALEKIEAGTGVVVRTRPGRAREWREYLSRTIDPQDVPEVVEDPTIEGDSCVIQTQLGKTELGLDVQLKEIEQGLLDLLARRPQVSR